MITFLKDSPWGWVEHRITELSSSGREVADPEPLLTARVCRLCKNGPVLGESSSGLDTDLPSAPGELGGLPTAPKVCRYRNQTG